MDVLITGANRGIGKALFKAFASKPNHTVIAGVRDLDTPQADFAAAMETLKSQHGIEKLDLVIANAGISKYFGKASITPVQQMLDHFTANAVGPLLLFPTTSSLLSTSIAPKFVTISSSAGSIGGMDKLPVENTAYGSSKIALNFIARRIYFENLHLIAFSINPGWLQTDVCSWAIT
ncbi:hypothetical protein B0J13DRAFT_591087 [Dactylonectria estremocensis]|uniref:Uncharacterized protein n=1 Tax=Dactylonectria estremocensis TaxID=1079267 RepID=A0A9P9D235_9HYPO|nr:hypothetical protein B0J13DRAFT_591087 [Dactylonectria estremocensis]